MISTLFRTGIWFGLFAWFVNYVRKHEGLSRMARSR
jgi:hypothetical protein